MAGSLESDQADLVGQLVGFDFEQAGSQAVRNLLGSASFGQLALTYLVTYIRAVTRQPAVIFLEDIHWADDRSLDLLLHIVNEVPDARLLVVCLARPALFEHRPQWCAEGETTPVQCRQLHLVPLSEDASHALVAQILQKLDDVPEVLSDLIIGGAEGNPYYVEELIKVLIDDGVIIRGDERWRIDLSRLRALRVPQTLTGVLQARLDSLPSEERTVLQRASVVGRLFWDAAVAALMTDVTESAGGIQEVVTVGQAQVRAVLEAIGERELVFRRGQSAFEGTDEYIFKHAILRDVTYETVLLKLRRVYHGQTARWLEANAGERLGEYLGLIAGHYELAGEAVKAAEYLMRLGEAARAVSDYYDAIAAFERALVLLPDADLARRITLFVRLGYAERQVSDYPMALRRLEEGLSLARAVGDGGMEAAALTGLGWALMGQGKYDEAKPYLVKALVLARKVGDRRGVALALHHLGDVAYRQGDSDEASRYAWECLALYRSLEDRQGIAGAFRILGFVTYMRGQYADAMRHHEESRRMYAGIGDRWGVGTGYINLGEVARRQGKFVEAAQYYEKSLPFFHEIGNRFGVTIATLNLGHVYNGMGNLETAERHFRDSVEKAHALGSVAILLEGALGLASICAKRGQTDIAAEWLGWVQAHPDYNAEIAQFAAPILDLLRASLSEAELEALLTLGAALELKAVVGKIKLLENRTSS